TLEASVAEEVARRLAAEEAQLQSQKVESLGRLTGGIAHDFNNMLAVIMGALGLIERRHKRGQEIGDLLSGAMDGARRAAELTQRLLAFSRQAPLELQVIDVNGLVTRLSEILSRTLGEDVPIDMVLTAGLWSALTDRGQLENVILNLAINARDAMPGGGKITIETANAELDERYARANVDVVPGQYVMLAVSDTGTGMPADVLKRAFEPFFTTKDVGKGTGLGLSQIFGYVKQANGHVKIESEVGRGTVVRIYLPRHTGADRALPQDTPSTDVVAVAERTVLIVEDDVRLRSITSANLQELGYAVLVAASAQDALDVIRGPRAIDLLFTDVVMPGMNGRQLADEAVKLRPALKVLFTTGFTNQSDAHSDILDKTAIYLAKPFSFEQLGQKVRSILA
ncbi:MAG: response regulator, partial [Sphingomonadales bacterium]